MLFLICVLGATQQVCTAAETLSKSRKVGTECRVVQEEQSTSCLSTCVFGVFTERFSAQGIFIITMRQILVKNARTCKDS